MPRQDGTGPMGEGPMTGRGMGRCGSAGAKTGPRQGGRGSEMGRGWGRRLRGWFGGGRGGWAGLPGWMGFGSDQAGGRAPLRAEVLRRQAERLREELTRVEGLLNDAEAPKPEEPR
jgi:hypothetical protein